MLRSIMLRVPVASVVDVDEDTIVRTPRFPHVVSIALTSIVSSSNQSLNVEAMRALLPEPPRVPQLPWRIVAGACESALGAVHRTVRDEFERNARFHAELEFGLEVCDLTCS